MATENQEQEAVVSTFPMPPAFYRLYGETSTGPLPPDPPPPIAGAFQVFNQPFNTEEPLVSTSANSMIQTQPDGSIDIKGQMLSLNQEVLFLFMELLRALVDSPAEHASALSRVTLTLNAMQHLTNLLRPRQAWATLEHALKCEVQDKQEALDKVKAQVDALDKLLASSSQSLAEASSKS
mmetsp:Transcript_25166/g.63862  ORF Transcript_25166/g.63862 Transcript_25166/m.63862 type:complete len:180 (+) Transcript_25166:157-696(+)